MTSLEDPALSVPHVADGAHGMAWLRSHVARFCDGPDHERRRAHAVRLLEAIDLAHLRRPGHPVATLAAALGMPRDAVVDVEIAAAGYQPHEPITPHTDAAVERLVAAAGGERNEATAARIGLLVQASGALTAWAKGSVPAVPFTRRRRPSGEEILIDLTDHPFGAGRHACPGEEQARALMDGVNRFADLHRGDEPLLLPNAWDCASATAFVADGYPALGTTSLGVAASHGLPDATGAAYRETMELARRLSVLPVPVSIDVEGGFGHDPAELALDLSVMGIAGINVEDGRGDHLTRAADHAAAITAIKDAAPALFVNARVDTHWLGAARDETASRVRAYAEAGADGVFVPGLREERTIEELVDLLGDVPLNLLAQLPWQRLRDLGVGRVSTGSWPFRAAITQAAAAVAAYRAGAHPPSARSYEEIERSRKEVFSDPWQPDQG
ncbi:MULTISPECIES: isocitrate lyase/phosphoenolpyruvate mutase family protein [unclassified Brevibacterium]|uniref:isocitrate lyase/PEP mutase family protein n=1 Tax=unclassified Brevibacterium TaxID=2614124 RepID=UPI001BB1AF56|nr:MULTISPECIES: isocitrate lyase/phosphoenolpyruvate mutase family protein [unclassified Brevibacterium]MCM1013322.1 isocitrate lyase/phosphoenolpyruvate mutase family protein [Brevibacterium sp. XM4083]